jgi:hypothetical protein
VDLVEGFAPEVRRLVDLDQQHRQRSARHPRRLLKDLELAHGAKPGGDPEETVVTCMIPGKKAEEATTPSGGVEPEIIGRKAAEEGEAEAGKE